MRAAGRALAAAAAACLLAASAGGCRRPAGPPDLAIQWPRPGTPVRPGEEVHFRLVVEPAGNHAFQLSRAGAGLAGRAEGAGIATIPWPVPLDAAPGERIDFTATARNTATNGIGSAATHVLVASTPSARASPGPAGEDWHGTWTGTASGGIYDDEAWVFFDFTVAPGGRIAGKGTGKLFPKPVARGDCTYTHVQAPETFDVRVTGRREAAHFALQLAGPGLVGTRTITAACAAGGGPAPAAPYDAFGVAGVHAAGLAPRVPADSGRLTVETTDPSSAMKVRHTTTIARGKRVRTARP